MDCLVQVAVPVPLYRLFDYRWSDSRDLLQLLRWASCYYHHPLGEVLHAALPQRLRQGQPAELAEREFFTWTGPEELPKGLDRAPVQRQVAQYLLQLQGKSVAGDSLTNIHPRWRSSIKPLLTKGLISVERA